MELAWHLRCNSRGCFSSREAEHLVSVYSEDPGHATMIAEQLPPPGRLYLGDEFCLNRLPTPQALAGILDVAGQNGLPVTLLTPVLTNQGIDACIELFDLLSRQGGKTEVTVNDIGVLFFLKKHYPSFRLSLGRLFNKGFKDPRLGRNESVHLSRGMDALFNDCSFNRSAVHELAVQLGIERLERDLLPYADVEFPIPNGVGTSIYFPYGYVTTGRVCFVAGLAQEKDRRFRLGEKCSKPCARIRLDLQHPDLNAPLIQNGNTIFYRYSFSVLAALVRYAENHRFRLVYQGEAL